MTISSIVNTIDFYIREFSPLISDFFEWTVQKISEIAQEFFVDSSPAGSTYEGVYTSWSLEAAERDSYRGVQHV